MAPQSEENDLDRDFALKRYDMENVSKGWDPVYQMVEGDQGDWVKREDVAGIASFIHGYLQSHCELLEANRGEAYARPIRKLMAAMEKLR